MFDQKSKRYMTRAIAEALPMEIALLLWQLIDAQKEQKMELDYLQVFELSIHEGKQAIIHRQEVPERKEQWLIRLVDTMPRTSTVWCMDDGENQMMLYPTDY